jgi:hypothetical protein
MRIELIRDLKIYDDNRNCQDYKKGEEVNIDDANGKSLIKSGFAILKEVIKEKKIEEKKIEVEEVKAIEASPSNKAFPLNKIKNK